jgi:hypothetical protein
MTMTQEEKIRCPWCLAFEGNYSAHVTARRVFCDEAVPSPAGDCFVTPLSSVPRNDTRRLSSYPELVYFVLMFFKLTLT